MLYYLLQQKEKAPQIRVLSSVWFPEGTWYDFFLDISYSGNTRLSVYREKGLIPAFAKEGAIIPLNSKVDTFGAELPELLEWHLFPEKSNVFHLIEDNEDGQRSVTSLEYDWIHGKVKLSIDDPKNVIPKNRQHKLIFHYTNQTSLLLENKDRSVDFNA